MSGNRIRLTAREIETILAVAGDALASETLSQGVERDEAERDLEAFERGMDKLRSMLAGRLALSGKGES